MTFILPPELVSLPHPFVIVTEGMSDARLVDKLLQLRGIRNCSVGCPSDKSSKGTGKNAFGRYFQVIQVARARTTSARTAGLLVVADADDDADKTFQAIGDALATARFPAPSQPFSIEGDVFRIAAYLLPGEHRAGTLEHLLLEAAFKHNPHVEKCLDELSACTGRLRSSNPNKHAKMRMSALAAAFCEDNPWCSANLMLCDPNSPVPVESPCFDHIANFLVRFSG